MNQDTTLPSLGTIAYDANGNVIWIPGDKGSPNRAVMCGQPLQFTFMGPGRVKEAMMMFAQQDATSPPLSPFSETGPLALTLSGASNDEFDYFTSPNTAREGTWGFSISFLAQTTQDSGVSNALGTVSTASTTSKFYFLPDPELAVGPGPGSGVPA